MSGCRLLPKAKPQQTQKGISSPGVVHKVTIADVIADVIGGKIAMFLLM